jgi:nucleoid-associated protein EbfC
MMGGGNPMKMLQQVQQMQARMAKVQKELEDETVEASAGGGAVKAVVTGQQKVVSVAIDPDLAGDVEMLQDLVVAALNEALDRSREVAAQKMGAVTAGLGLPPGLLG